jgi:hypothetical protein
VAVPERAPQASPAGPSGGRASRGWPLVAVGYALLALLVGYLAATGLNGALAISFQDKSLPTEPILAVPTGQASRLAQVPDIEAIAMPDGYAADPLLSHAAERLASAVEARTGERPAVAVGSVADLVAAVDAGLPAGGYALGGGGVVGGDRNGLADGLFAAALAIEAGSALPGSQAEPVVADLQYRYVDMGAVGVQPDPEAWQAQDDYSHNSGAFADVILADDPYIDPEGMSRARADWEAYVRHIRAYGYNGIVVNGFLEYVNFDGVGDGMQIYPADSPYRARHDAMVDQFGAMWSYAADMGMDVVFKTDMLALTGPLEDYFDRELGGIDPDDPRLWEVYRSGLDEFLTRMPFVTGLMIRIGEAGTVYNLEGWDYYSALEVTSVASVQTMLEQFTAEAAEQGRTVFFRTWSVGVGEVGDMHTSIETYDAVLAGIEAENLVAVTKYTMGDFYSWLPDNPTLRHGDEPRVVEFQSRREFEAFSSIPNHLSTHHQQALQGFAQDNSNIQGIWVWTQDGGPWRAGPMSLYLKTGFWQLYDADVYATGRLGWDLDTDVGAATRDWVARTLSDDPATAEALMQVLADSREVVRDGLYVAPYAREQVRALGLEPPPMMWIFEWDIVSGDSAALSAIHHVSRDAVDEAVARGRDAVAGAEQMLATVQATDPGAWHDPALRDQLVHSLAYEVDLLRTLQAFREAFLAYYAWLDAGRSADWAAWTEAKARYDNAVAGHLAAYTGDLDTPAFSFFAVDAGFGHAERTPAARVVTGLVLLGILGLALLGGPLGRQWRTSALGCAARALWLGATRPWRLVADPPVPRPRGARTLVLVLPAGLLVASRSAFSDWLSWSYLLATLGSMALYVLVIRVLLGRVDAFALYAAAGGALLARTALLSAITVGRGPLGYWYRMWTDEQWRTVYTTVAVAGFLWLFLVTYAVLRTCYGRTRPRALGLVLLGIAAPMVALGALTAWSGLEAALTTFNDQMALLPLGLSRILGITVHLGIPTELPLYLLAAGVVLALAGLLLGATRRPA